MSTGTVASELAAATPAPKRFDKNIEIVNLSELSVDRTYQRPVTQKMERMGQNWKPDIAGVITLSKRSDQTLWIIDGQNRVGAALMAGVPELEADIREGLTLEEEAKLFDELNSTHTNVSAIDRFKARLVYHDPEAVDIKNIVESFGGAIADKISMGRSDDPSIRAVASLNRVYRKQSGEGLKDILTIINDSWGGVDKETTNELTLGGILEFLTRQKRFDKKRLVTRLSEEGLSNMKRMAHAHGQIFGGSGNKNFYRAMVEVYNKGLATRNRLS